MGATTTVPVDQLRAAGYGDAVESVATAVAGYLDDGVGTTVAVVSDPYGGRDALLEYAATLLEDRTERVTLEDIVTGDPPEIPDDRALLLENAHHLFHRAIGGFDALATFLDRMALSDTLVIAAWNRHAWRYLDAVRNVGDSFSRLVTIPPLDANEVRAVVEAHADTEAIEFVDTGAAGRIKTVVFGRVRLELPLLRRIAIPYPKPNPAWVKSWHERDERKSIEAVVYEKIRRVSHGNPGVTTTVWNESVEDGTVAPAYVDAPAIDLDLDDDEAFLLWNVLAHESIDRAHLAELVGKGAVNTDLQRLADRDLVTILDGRAHIAPMALHPTIDALERRQLLW